MKGIKSLLSAFFSVEKTTKCHIEYFLDDNPPEKEAIILRLARSDRAGSRLALEITLQPNGRYDILEL